jgi:hypothetical protein
MVTNVFAAAAFSALSFTFQPDVRTAYISRGHISEDRPIQSNLLRLETQPGDWGAVGLWHWHYNSLTPRLRDKRDRQMTELDWGVLYNYSLRIADGWSLDSEFMTRWFTMLFYHHPYKGKSDHSIFEYYYDASLKNPYLIPTVRFRRGLHGQDYLYSRVGVKKPLQSICSWLPEKLTVTPAFYTDFGNENMRQRRYGQYRPGGSMWGAGVMSILGEVGVSYPINRHFSVYATLQQFAIVSHDARDATHSPKHRDYTVFIAGFKCKF